MKKLFQWISRLEDKKILGIVFISQSSIDFFTLLIIFSAGLMGYELVHPTSFLVLIQRVILYIFLLEIILRAIIAYSNKDLNRHMIDPWTIFDIIVVGAGFVPSSFQDISNILRIFRVFRILRVIKVFPDIKLIVSIILKCIPRMGAIGVLLVILMYVYAIIGIDTFRGGQQGFSSFQEAFFTLFMELTGEEWAQMRNEGVSQYGYFTPTIFHVTWILLSSFLVLNLFIGVILDSFSSLRASELNRKKFLELSLSKPYTLVLGWNEDIKILIKNFIEANRSLTKSTLVIMADKEFEEMDNYLLSQVYTEMEGKKLYTEIIPRKGNCRNAHNLSLVTNKNCKTIVILPEKTLISDPQEQMRHDLMVIDILTNLSGLLYREKLSTPEIITAYYDTIPDPLPEDPRLVSFDTITRFNPTHISGKLLGRLTIAEASYEVFEQIFSFKGCELYLGLTGRKSEISLPQTKNKCMKNILDNFYPSRPIGWITWSGEVHLGPKAVFESDYKLQDNDRPIILAEDDSVIRFTGKNNMLRKAKSDGRISEKTIQMQLQHLLVMGWGTITREYLQVLNANLDVGKVTMAIDNENDKAEIEAFWQNMKLELADIVILKEITDCFAMFHESTTPLTSAILISSEIFEVETDIRDILSVIQAKNISKDLRFITEINHANYIPAVSMFGLKDILFPNYFLMGLFSILAEEPGLLPVYQQLLDSKDIAVSIITLEEFQQNMESYLLLGFYRNEEDHDGNQVVLCPDVSILEPLSPKDRLVVLS